MVTQLNNELLSNKDVCSTAPAKPGLIKFDLTNSSCDKKSHTVTKHKNSI